MEKTLSKTKDSNTLILEKMIELLDTLENACVNHCKINETKVVHILVIKQFTNNLRKHLTKSLQP